MDIFLQVINNSNESIDYDEENERDIGSKHNLMQVKESLKTFRSEINKLPVMKASAFKIESTTGDNMLKLLEKAEVVRGFLNSPISQTRFSLSLKCISFADIKSLHRQSGQIHHVLDRSNGAGGQRFAKGLGTVESCVFERIGKFG